MASLYSFGYSFKNLNFSPAKVFFKEKTILVLMGPSHAIKLNDVFSRKRRQIKDFGTYSINSCIHPMLLNILGA